MRRHAARPSGTGQVTDDDRASYRRQFDAAKRHLPRGHVIVHSTWRDGQLSVMSAPAEKPATTEPQFVARVRRGARQEDLFG
jgi:uncharacterized membrane protein YccC